MLNPSDSLDEASRLAARDPEHYAVGLQGWVTARFSHDEPPPDDLLDRWIDESFRLLAPKQLVAMMDDSGSSIPRKAATASARKRATPKKMTKKTAKKPVKRTAAKKKAGKKKPAKKKAQRR